MCFLSSLAFLSYICLFWRYFCLSIVGKLTQRKNSNIATCCQSCPPTARTEKDGVERVSQEGRARLERATKNWGGIHVLFPVITNYLWQSSFHWQTLFSPRWLYDTSSPLHFRQQRKIPGGVQWTQLSSSWSLVTGCQQALKTPGQTPSLACFLHFDGWLTEWLANWLAGWLADWVLFQVGYS